MKICDITEPPVKFTFSKVGVTKNFFQKSGESLL